MEIPKIPLEVRFDDAMPILELAIFQQGVTAEDQWIPCKFPERPLDRNAAIKHVIRGEPCKACAIAQDAFFKSNRRYSYGTDGTPEGRHQ